MSKPAPRPSNSSPPQLKLSPRTVLVLFAAVVLYLLMRPTLSGWLGMELPGLFPEEQVAVNVPEETPRPTAEAPSPRSVPQASAVPEPEVRPPAVSKSGTTAEPSISPAGVAPPQRSDSTSIAKSTSPSTATIAKPAMPVVKPADASRPSTTTTRNSTSPQPRTSPNSTTRPPPATPKATTPTSSELGQLTDLGGKRFRSTAGLIYVQERSEHRIDHVLRHGEDDPSRPVHGVFTGDRETILAVIDEAWQLAQKGRPPKVEVEEQGDRLVYIVDLGRKIGFMGGQAGKRKRFPPCKHLQLVVEGNEVVTAYPTIPR